ncbi:MAG TPA: hypothetical protein VF044_09385 [Actinomycetota bacterium]
MNGSKRLAVWSIATFLALGAAARSVAAAATLASERGASASSYAYTLDTREDLTGRRRAFDPGDGLQRWERLLLAMDPNGAANAGR